MDTVRYQYYTTGELRSVTRAQQGFYVDTLMSNIQYNVFGQQTYQLYGNGVESFYTYLPQRQRLMKKQTRIPSGSQIQDLYYSYDNVGNIMQIGQNEPSWGSLGGPYTNNYTYDHQYRLLSATETSSPTFNVNFSASYSPAGRLGHDYCGANNVNKQLTYGYDIDGQTHQPRVIYDGTPGLSYDLYWDANGNLAQVVQCKQDQARFHLWDDNNRLHAVIGPNQAGFYGYDGNGDRVWKLMGKCSLTSQNGGEVSYSTLLDDAVLYPNPYLTITPTGYTKHYYIGSERIATAIGEGGWANAMVNLNVHDVYVAKKFFEHYISKLPCDQHSWTKNEDIYGNKLDELQYDCGSKCLQIVDVLYNQNGYLYNVIYQHQKPSGKLESLFFTHSDHLGSASWITNGIGKPVQYIHYAPYGELMANQKTSSFDERYKFTGKERDAESGYYYHGARFLLSDAGIWLSVDPLADKYPNISPYAYCAWNPIKYIDPDGEENVDALSRNDSRTPMIRNAIQKFPVNSEVIHLWAHGNNKGIEIGDPNSDGTTMIDSPENLYLFLMGASSIWKNRAEGEAVIIVLHSCSTGEGDNSIAQQFSASPLFENTLFVAPSRELVVADGVEYGPADKTNLDNVGAWKMFLNGKMVNSFLGTSLPLFNNPQQHINRYLDF